MRSRLNEAGCINNECVTKTNFKFVDLKSSLRYPDQPPAGIANAEVLQRTSWKIRVSNTNELIKFVHLLIVRPLESKRHDSAQSLVYQV